MNKSPYPAPPEWGQAVEIAEGVLWARLPLPFSGLDHVNVYALADDGGWTIIDTGVRSNKGKTIWQGLLDGPLGGKPIRRVIVTHHHPDHIGLAGWFVARFDVPLLTSRTAFFLARMLQLDHWEVPPPEAERFYLSAGYDEAAMAAYRQRAPFNFSVSVEKLPLGFTRLQAGERLRIGGAEWQVMQGDGHAPEHLVFYRAADRVLLSGDQVLPGISSNLGAYPTEPLADTVGDWVRSCAQLRDSLPDDVLVLPGHREPFRGLHFRLNQLIDNHEAALLRLEAWLSEPRTVVECFPAIYKRPIGDEEVGLATVEALAHLNYLLLRGRATRTMNDRGWWIWQAAPAKGSADNRDLWPALRPEVGVSLADGAPQDHGLG